MPFTKKLDSEVRLSQHRAPSRARPAVSALAGACVLAMAAAAQAQISVPPMSEVPAAVNASLLAGNAGLVRLIVQFNEAPVSRMRPNIDLRKADRAELRAYRSQLIGAKSQRLAAIRAMGGRVQNTVEYAVNGAIIELPASRIDVLRRLPGVKSVRPAGVYEMSQAAPPTVGELIRTAQLNASGNGGAGVAVAIIDSGVDYTHASFQGPGTVSYYQMAVSGTNPTVITDTPGVYPNGPRVKGGYDWLGDTWSGSAANPGGLLITPDPDPIDNRQLASGFAGHGTNSASAAAGSAVPAGNIRAGSAPASMVLAYRGCSRLSRSCEGSALLNSVESVMAYAAGDPNANQPGANNPVLPAGTRFVINMSLGANYGNPQVDDLSEASRNASRAGITVVASAGNAGNIPMIVGTPSATDMVISVAASQPALLTGPSLQVGAPLNASYPIIAGSFGVPITSAVTAPLSLAGPNNTLINNLNLACSTVNTGAADPGPANPAIPSLTGTFGLSDRGTCGFNEKALNTQRAGALASIIINNAVGAGAIGMAAGPAAVNTTIPSYSLGTAEGAAVKAALIGNPGLQATINPLGDAANTAAGVNLTNVVADFTSRGATQNNMAMKPDIIAPGVSIYMATIGSGNQGAPSSGTSFSSPLAAGAAALVLSARPTYTPWQVKAAMMNTANPGVFASKTATTTVLAGLTRMGAGLVDAERAASTTTLAYDSEDIDAGAGSYYNASLSFGPQAFSAPGASTVSRRVVVQNVGVESRTYNLSTTLRFANDAAKAISFSTSVPSITVAPGSTGSFDVIATAVGSALPTSAGRPVRLTQDDTCTTNANPPAPVAACTSKFDDVEIDGFVLINGGTPTDAVSVPFLMYPRQASDVSVQRLGTSLFTRNTGAATTTVDVFNLIGAQDAQDQPALVPGSEEQPVDLRALGLRYLVNGLAGTPPAGATNDLLQIAVTTWKPTDTLRSSVFNVEFDSNGDGVTDFTVQNLTSSTNRNFAFITPAGGSPGNAFFATAFPLNSSRAVMTVLPGFMGITANTRFGVRVRSVNFFGSTRVWDTLPDNGGFLYVRPNAMVNVPSSLGFTQAPGVTNRITFTSSAANQATSPGDKGLLLIHGDNPVARAVTPMQLVP